MHPKLAEYSSKNFYLDKMITNINVDDKENISNFPFKNNIPMFFCHIKRPENTENNK